MIASAAALALFGQPALAAPPAPPAPRAEQMAAELRRLCMSEEAIAIVVEDWARNQQDARARRPEGDAIHRELGEAAHTLPIDVDRLERAAQARNGHQAALLAENTRRSMATMRRLPPQDRAIYARRFSILQTFAPERSCPARDR